MPDETYTDRLRLCACARVCVSNDVAIREIKRARASRYLHECRDANGDELRMVASTRRDGNVAKGGHFRNLSGMEMDPVKAMVARVWKPRRSMNVQ